MNGSCWQRSNSLFVAKPGHALGWTMSNGNGSLHGRKANRPWTTQL